MQTAPRSWMRPGLKKFASPWSKTSRPQMEDTLSSFIDSFLLMITVEKGLSKNTIEAYSRDLSRLTEFLLSQNVNSWADVTPLPAWGGYFNRSHSKLPSCAHSLH